MKGRKARSAEIQPPKAALEELRRDFTAVEALLASPGGPEYLRAGLGAWSLTGLQMQRALRWRQLDHRLVYKWTFGHEPRWGWEIGPLLRIPLWPDDWALFVLAYLARCAQQDGSDWPGISARMAEVWRWLLARSEFHKRLIKHPLGALLWLVLASTEKPSQGEPRWAAPVTGEIERRMTKELLRRRALHLSISLGDPPPGGRAGEGAKRLRKSRSDRRDLPWLRGVLGEADPSALVEEASGLLGRRIAEEVKDLRSLPLQDAAARAMGGLLDYHKKAVEQAVLRGRRPARERHVPAADPREMAESGQRRVRFHTEPEKNQARKHNEPEVDPHEVARAWGGPAESDPIHEAEAAAADPERVATKVIRAFRLSPAQARIVRYIVHHPDPSGLTMDEIAAGAGASPRTVAAIFQTVRKLAGDEVTFLRILSHQ